MTQANDRADGPDPYDLTRFVWAQADDYERALAEIKGGEKRSHWMWYVFPQLDGLASSPTSRHFAIKGLDEARAYLDHPVLGPRLLECSEALIGVEGRSAQEVADILHTTVGTVYHCKSRVMARLRKKVAEVEGDE